MKLFQIIDYDQVNEYESVRKDDYVGFADYYLSQFINKGWPLVYFFWHAGHPQTDFLGWIWGEENDGEIIIICFILFFEAELTFSDQKNKVLESKKVDFYFHLEMILKDSK